VRLSYLDESARQVLPEHAITLVDTHDLMHERAARFQPRGEEHDFAISAEEEAEALSLLDHMLAIQSVEALCYLRPLVTTPIGAEGLERGAGYAFIVYTTSEEAVQAIADLAEQPRLRKELAARAYSFAS
jgi:hypothetical protein